MLSRLHLDPLSFSASVVGILTVTGATVAKLDALFNDLRSRPGHAFGNFPGDICALLSWCLDSWKLEGQLHGRSSSGMKENENALLAVLDLCMQTFRQINSQVSELQSKFRKGPLARHTLSIEDEGDI
jgi:hypothetical protein